jgi:hypothetical protein
MLDIGRLPGQEQQAAQRLVAHRYTSVAASASPTMAHTLNNALVTTADAEGEQRGQGKDNNSLAVWVPQAC